MKAGEAGRKAVPEAARPREVHLSHRTENAGCSRSHSPHYSIHCSFEKSDSHGLSVRLALVDVGLQELDRPVNAELGGIDGNFVEARVAPLGGGVVVVVGLPLAVLGLDGGEGLFLVHVVDPHDPLHLRVLIRQDEDGDHAVEAFQDRLGAAADDDEGVAVFRLLLQVVELHDGEVLGRRSREAPDGDIDGRAGELVIFLELVGIGHLLVLGDFPHEIVVVEGQVEVLRNALGNLVAAGAELPADGYDELVFLFHKAFPPICLLFVKTYFSEIFVSRKSFFFLLNIILYSERKLCIFHKFFTDVTYFLEI